MFDHQDSWMWYGGESVYKRLIAVILIISLTVTILPITVNADNMTYFTDNALSTVDDGNAFTNPFTGIDWMLDVYIDFDDATVYVILIHVGSEDPIRDGLNWYTYCAGNPIRFIDPWGLALVNTVDYATAMGAEIEHYQKNGLAHVKIKANGVTQYFTNYRGGKIDDKVMNDIFNWQSFLSDVDRKVGVEISISDNKLYYDVSKPMANLMFDASIISTYISNALPMDNKITWWISMVTHNGPWDIKQEKSWDHSLGITYPGWGSTVVFLNQYLSLNDLGNILYGYAGIPLGFSPEVLAMGADFAKGMVDLNPISGVPILGITIGKAIGGIGGMIAKIDDGKHMITYGINLYNNNTWIYKYRDMTINATN